MNHRTVTSIVALCLVLGGCAHIDDDERDETVIVVPSAATSSPQYHGDGSIPDRRPVVRMSDGERDWEVEMPRTERGYEMRVPLRDSRRVRADHHSLTRADRELLEHLRLSDSQYEREGTYVDGEHTVDREAHRQQGLDPDDSEHTEDTSSQTERSEAAAAPTRPSYFKGIDQVRQLYEAGHHEQAMIQLADLERAYPDDEQILSMKGTLWLELGREQLARDNWERVLQINPDNEAVQNAVRRLDGGLDDHQLDEQQQIEELEQRQME